MKTLFLTLLLALSLTAPGWADGPVLWDTTRFIQDGTYPYTDPAEDYKSHTSGVAVFLSATQSWPEDIPDAIRWVHHFTPPPSDSILGAWLAITLKEDDLPFWDGGPSDHPPGLGHLSIEGYWTTPADMYVSSHWSSAVTDITNGLGQFGVDYGGTWTFELSPTKMSWLYSGELDCVFYAEQGDFYIVRSDLIVALNQPAPDPNGVPEPVTLLFLGFGLFGLAGFRRKSKR